MHAAGVFIVQFFCIQNMGVFLQAFRGYLFI